MCEINYMLYFTHHNLKGYVVSINVFFPELKNWYDNTLGSKHGRQLDSPGS